MSKSAVTISVCNFVWTYIILLSKVLERELPDDMVIYMI